MGVKVNRMVRVVPELRNALMERGKWAAFVAACERNTRDGVGESCARDDAIDEVCPDLAQFKRRKRVKQFEASVDKKAEERVNDASCNAFRMLEWVVENHEHVGETTEYNAPSRAAYAILVACAKDEDAYRDVMKKYLDAKLKLDLAQGDTETRKLDGQREYDILEGLKLEVGG